MMTNITTTTRRQVTLAGVRIRWTERDGYIVGRRCPYDHSGNRGLVYDAGWLQCQGCGHQYAAEALLDPTWLSACRG